jgi:hypothetical protein
MAYDQKEGDVSLFRNDKKQPGSNQPDMRGTGILNGEKIKFSLWTKGEGSKKFLAGKIELDTYVKSEQNTPTSQDEPDSLPF